MGENRSTRSDTLEFGVSLIQNFALTIDEFEILERGGFSIHQVQLYTCGLIYRLNIVSLRSFCELTPEL